VARKEECFANAPANPEDGHEQAIENRQKAVEHCENLAERQCRPGSGHENR
jgi:hypothetical protein